MREKVRYTAITHLHASISLSLSLARARGYEGKMHDETILPSLSRRRYRRCCGGGRLRGEEKREDFF